MDPDYPYQATSEPTDILDVQLWLVNAAGADENHSSNWPRTSLIDSVGMSPRLKISRSRIGRALAQASAPPWLDVMEP